jgi:hypothetical protein
LGAGTAQRSVADQLAARANRVTAHHGGYFPQASTSARHDSAPLM